MQFQVPQFIDREAQVVGPLTFRQFSFLAVAGGAAFILYFFAPLVIFVPATVVLAGIGLLAAFVQVGGKSLPALFVDFLNFQMGGKIYYWKKKRVFTDTGQAEAAQAPSETVVQSHTTQIALSKESKIGRLSTKIEVS